MVAAEIDCNTRLYPYIESQVFDQKTQGSAVVRIFQATLPFLVMWEPTARVLVGCDSAYSSLDSTVRCFRQIKAGSYATALGELCRSVYQVGSIGIFAFHPMGYAIAAHTFTITVEARGVGCNLMRGHFARASTGLLRMAHQSVYVASLVMGGPELLAISLIAQAAFECYRARHYFIKEMYLEALMNMALTVLRVYTAASHVEKIWFNVNCRKITSEEFINLAKSGSKEMPLDVRWIDLSEKKLNDVCIHDVRFSNCRFNQTKVSGVEFESVSFKNCEFKGAQFDHCFFKDVWWIHTDLLDAQWFNSKINKCMFRLSRLMESSFSQASVDHSFIIECDLTNTLFANGENPFWTIGS